MSYYETDYSDPMDDIYDWRDGQKLLTTEQEHAVHEIGSQFNSYLGRPEIQLDIVQRGLSQLIEGVLVQEMPTNVVELHPAKPETVFVVSRSDVATKKLLP